jgi:hypothetical protein
VFYKFWKGFCNFWNAFYNFWKGFCKFWNAFYKFWKGFYGFWNAFYNFWRVFYNFWKGFYKFWRVFCGFWKDFRDFRRRRPARRAGFAPIPLRRSSRLGGTKWRSCPRRYGQTRRRAGRVFSRVCGHIRGVSRFSLSSGLHIAGLIFRRIGGRACTVAGDGRLDGGEPEGFETSGAG